MNSWRCAVRGVWPDLTPCPTPGISLDLWFGDDETAAREWFSSWEGEAVLYQTDDALGELGRTVIERKN
jgi:hypothetical protein